MACKEQPENYAVELRKKKAEARNLKNNLRDLTRVVTQFMAALDAEMKLSSDAGRGSRIAELTNALNLQNDVARRFGLGER